MKYNLANIQSLTKQDYLPFASASSWAFKIETDFATVIIDAEENTIHTANIRYSVTVVFNDEYGTELRCNFLTHQHAEMLACYVANQVDDEMHVDNSPEKRVALGNNVPVTHLVYSSTEDEAVAKKRYNFCIWLLRTSLNFDLVNG
jgi:hypothetical protein